MHEREDTFHSGRNRLSAVRGELGSPSARARTRQRPVEALISTDRCQVAEEASPVRQASSLLRIATTMAQGADRVHTLLRRLDPDEREEIVNLVADQVTEIVSIWTDLLRGGDADTERDVLPFRHDEQVQQDLRDPLRDISPDSTRDVTHDPRGLDEATPREEGGLSRDELTGVLKCRPGLIALDREIERCRRSHTALVVGYLNVSGFREINQSRGPRVGDELLRKVASALRATLRSYDVILRLRDDKFVFSLPGTDMTTARQRAKEFAVILAEEAPWASTRIGYAELGPQDSVDELISRAGSNLLSPNHAQRRAQ